MINDIDALNMYTAGIIPIATDLNDLDKSPISVPWEDTEEKIKNLYKNKLSKILEVDAITPEVADNLLKMIDSNDPESFDLAYMLIDTKMNANTEEIINQWNYNLQQKITSTKV